MARKKNEQITQIEKDIDSIGNSIDYDFTNSLIDRNELMKDFELSKKTITNIGRWALDGKTEYEIRNNLELSKKEWDYLCKVCPSVVFVMKRSYAFADLMVAGTLYQTAVGGYSIKKKAPIKIKEYEINPMTGNSMVVGEHIEIVEYDEEQPPNPNLLKYLAEHKLSEKFGEKKVDNSREHREIIEVLDENTIKELEELASGK